MSKFEMQESKRDGQPVFSLVGHLDKEFSNLLKQKLDQTLALEVFQTLYLDLSRLQLVDSVGLGLMIFYHSYLKADHRELVLLDPQGEIESLLEISCLDRVLKIRRS